MKRTLRERIGNRFQFYRHQVRAWKSFNRAAKEIRARFPKSKLDGKTIEAIEGGAENPRWSSLEAYALGIDVPLEQILREALTPLTIERRALDPEARHLLDIFSDLDDANERRVVIDMAERAQIVARHRKGAAGPMSDEAVDVPPEEAHGDHERKQKFQRPKRRSG